MTTTSTTPSTESSDAPITNFSQCHVGIIAHLETLGELPALVEAAGRARKVAEETLRFFRDAVYEHHEEEERELFPAVVASATPGDELSRVTGMVAQLTREHRQIESMWTQLEPHLKKVAKGQSDDLPAATVAALVREYSAHAAFEESEFLPLSQVILSRNSNHMAALGLSLHMRHVPPAMAYI